MTVRATIPHIPNDALGIEAVCKKHRIYAIFSRVDLSGQRIPGNKVIVRVDPTPASDRDLRKADILIGYCVRHKIDVECMDDLGDGSSDDTH